MGKKKEDKWLGVGNFLLGVDKNAHGQYVVLKTVSGNWSVRWRDDTMMFGLMLSLAREEGAHEYLHSLITAMFAVTTYPHDLVAITEKQETPFMMGLIELINRQNEYEASLRPQPTDEEEKESLEEMKRMAEIESEMAELVKEESEDEDKVHAEGV